jgi:hypothetical protein
MTDDKTASTPPSPETTAPKKSTDDYIVRPPELSVTRNSKRSILSMIKLESQPVPTHPKRAESWTESMLESLEPHEHDFQEFKGSGWIMRSPKEVQPDFLFFLSKQASAFSNGSGGYLIIGINDSGEVDGGVPVHLKNGTRPWLEDLVAACVDPPLPQCNVFEVLARTDGPSKISPGNGVYVIELPASQNAPHQAKDHRYYLRIAGKSRPMGHVHVQDVLRRAFHPKVELARFGPYGQFQRDTSDPRGPRAFIQFRLFIANRGRTLARHAGLEVSVPRPFAGTEVRQRMKQQDESHYTQTSGTLTYFRHHPTPLFPTQEVYGLSVWVCLHQKNLAHVRNGAELAWVIYADDARPAHGHQTLNDYQIIHRAQNGVEEASESQD